MGDYVLADLSALSITELYEDESSLRWLMNTAIGITDAACHNRIVKDGYSSVSTIIRQHSNDVKGFTTYLVSLNKTFASAQEAAMRVYYLPVIISRYAGVIHYFDQCVNSLHTIPEMSFFDTDQVTELSTQYVAFTKQADNDNNKMNIDIPIVTGSSHWVNF